MSAKDILFGSQVREKMLEGINLLEKVVKSTMGPMGRNVLLDRQFGTPRVTKDGVSVAKEFELSDKFANSAAQIVKEAAVKTGDRAGDGTTTSVVLAANIIREGLKKDVFGVNMVEMINAMNNAASAIENELHKLSKTVSESDEIAQVGTISANGDKEIGKILSINHYRLKYLRQEGQDYDLNELLECIDQLSKLDVEIKTGKIDKKVGLELFMIRI